MSATQLLVRRFSIFHHRVLLCRMTLTPVPRRARRARALGSSATWPSLFLQQHNLKPQRCFFQDDIDPSATPRTPRERIGLTGNLASISMPGDSGAEVTPRPIDFSDSGSEGGSSFSSGSSRRFK